MREAEKEKDHKIGVEEGAELGAALKVMVQSTDLCCDESLNTFPTSHVSSDGLPSSCLVGADCGQLCKPP